MKYSKENLPLVTVYMPTKNRRELLVRAVESIFSQTYPNIEIIIVDDGSTDDTPKYLAELANEYSNLTFYRNETSTGACAARNIAIKHAKGSFITGLDDDDLFLANRIAELVEAYDPKFAFVCSSMWWDYGKKQRLIDKGELTITLPMQLSYNEATTQVLVETDRVRAIGGFDESFVACQDYDLWTALLVKYGVAKRISSPSYVVNDTGSSIRMISSPRSVKGYHQFFEKYGDLMSDINKKNQAFMRLRREARKMTVGELAEQIGCGHFQSKFRYFLSSNLVFVRDLHRKFYKKP